MSKVLIVDDEPEVRHLLTSIVREAGHDTYEAHDGADALVQIKAVKPDLIFLDYQLPELRGDAVLEKLRNDSEFTDVSKTVVVMLTDFSEALTRQDLQRLGANHVVAKQDTPELMKEHVQMAMLGLSGESGT